MFSGDSVYKKVKVLSGGEKSRLSLARLMLKPVNLLILDEPTNHLDMAAKDVLKQALIEYQGSLIIVSHDREFLEGLTNKTVEFKNNQIREFLGDINYYLEKTQIENLQQLEIKTQNETAVKSESSSKSQLDRESRKALQRDLNRAQKDITVIETEIAELEAENSELDLKFLNAEFYNDKNKLRKSQELHSRNQQKIQNLYNNWAELTEKIENLTKEL